jgi:NAD(P)-dependent dehydrogenase (short-subunit alcohol dehydrogenase family)
MISEVLRKPLSLFDVRDKVVIITGASGSFGHACAVALGALGAKLLLASGTAEELQSVVDDVGEVGGKVAAIVRRPDAMEDAEAILQAALNAYGQVDRLVVASGTNKAGFIESQSYEDWQRVMDANVRGPWLMAKAVGSYWIREGIKGKVVLMSSTRGRHGNFSGYSAYCSSKGATDGLTRVLATEWAKYGTTVNAIAPTTFRSKLTEWNPDANAFADSSWAPRRGGGFGRHGDLSAVAGFRFLHRANHVRRRRLHRWLGRMETLASL